MSIEYELALGKRGNDNLRTLLETWARVTGIDASTAISFREDPPCAYVLVPGASIRGFSVTSAPHARTLKLSVRINVCAGSEDWRLLYSLLTFLLERRARGQREDGVPLAIAELTTAASLDQWVAQFRSDIRVLQAALQHDGDEPARLPNYRFPIAVRRSEIPQSDCTREDLEHFQTLLQTRVGLYWQARDASTIVLDDGRRMIVWTGDAMLSEGADLVAISEQVDREPSRVLPWSVLLQQASNAVETIPGTPLLYYLRSIDTAVAGDVEMWRSLVSRSGTLESLRHH